MNPGQTMSACETCPAHKSAHLKKLGGRVDDWGFVVALAGNPNTGKSTVFNALTGLRQHVGNWPGKTVARAEGGFNFHDRNYKLIDLPGTYSLLSTSTDEEIARDFILFGQPDVTIIVADATRLERNLNLTLQVLEITDRAVVALNLVDEAKRHGLQVDERCLARELGVPVVPMVARRGAGVAELLEAIEKVAVGAYRSRPHRIQPADPHLENMLAEMVAVINEKLPGLPNARWVALRLLDGDPAIERAIRNRTLGDFSRGQDTMLMSDRLLRETAS